MARPSTFWNVKYGFIAPERVTDRGILSLLNVDENLENIKEAHPEMSGAEVGELIRIIAATADLMGRDVGFRTTVVEVTRAYLRGKREGSV